MKKALDEEERYRRLKVLEAVVDALPEVIGTRKILLLAKELKELTPIRQKGSNANVE